MLVENLHLFYSHEKYQYQFDTCLLDIFGDITSINLVKFHFVDEILVRCKVDIYAAAASSDQLLVCHLPILCLHA